jgi:hypothetical protein
VRVPSIRAPVFTLTPSFAGIFSIREDNPRQARGNATVKKGALVTGRGIIIGAGYFILISPASAGRILFLFRQQLTFETQLLKAKGIGSALWQVRIYQELSNGSRRDEHLRSRRPKV